MSKFYTKEDAAEYARGKPHFILWNEYDHSFMVYSDVYGYISGTQYPNMHEVVLANDYRKFFFDIDFSINKAGDMMEDEVLDKINTANQHVQNIIAWLVEEMSTRYNKNITRDRVAIVDSSAWCGLQHRYYKYSKNIILVDYCFSADEFMALGTMVRNKYLTKGGLDTFIDNKQFTSYSFNNRFVGCTKVGEERYKTCEEFPRQDLAITNTENTIRFGKKRRPQVCSEFLEISVDIQGILDATEYYWIDDFEFTRYRQNRLEFKRLRPSYCKSCDRDHDSDNTLRIIVKATHLVIACIKSDKILGSLSWDTEEDEIVEEEVVDTVPHIEDHAFNNDCPIKFIKANMKMGKTKECKKYLESLGDVTIVLVSFRRTFTAEMKANFDNFTSYEEITGPIDLNEHNRLIIQVESLHRIIPRSTLQSYCLVLDEVESIWSQFSSGNFVNYYGSSAIFESLYKHSKVVIAMDAHLSPRTKRLSQLLVDKPIHEYHNKHNRTISPYVFVNPGEWLTRFYSLLQDGNKIAVFTNTLTEAKKIAKLASICINVDGVTTPLRVMCYNSETLESIKSTHFADVGKYWSQYDVIVCTPTISAGVSFEEKHFDYVFGYFGNHSCNVETCQQMIGRVRDVKEKIYIYCENTYSGRYPTNIAEIKEYLSVRRDSAINDLASAYSIGDLSYSYDVDYNAYYHEDFRYALTIENIAFDNHSRNGFRDHFVKLLKNCGYVIGEPEIIIENPEVIAEYMGHATVISEELVESVNAAQHITKLEYDELIENRIRRVDVTVDQIYEMQKYKLVTAFPTLDSFCVATVKKFYKKQSSWAQLTHTEDILCNPGTWDERIETSRQDDLLSMTSQYNYHGIMDTNRVSYRSHTHKKVKAILEAYPFDGLLPGIQGFFQMFTGCKIRPSETTKAKLDAFFRVARENIPHITGNVITQGSDKTVIYTIANMMKIIYLCDYSKISGNGLHIRASPAVMIEFDNSLYKGGSGDKTAKKDVPIIIIKS